jgi:uncharacterized protein
MTEIVVLADTHIRRGSSRRLPAAVYDALDGTDLVLHAGDVVTGDLLEELAGFAPTVAVLGNNDGELVGRLPEDRVLTVDGLRIAMVHDSGARKGREGRLRRRYPTADLACSATATCRSTPSGSTASACSTPDRRPRDGRTPRT